MHRIFIYVLLCVEAFVGTCVYGVYGTSPTPSPTKPPTPTTPKQITGGAATVQRGGDLLRGRAQGAHRAGEDPVALRNHRRGTILYIHIHIVLISGEEHAKRVGHPPTNPPGQYQPYQHTRTTHDTPQPHRSISTHNPDTRTGAPHQEREVGALQGRARLPGPLPPPHHGDAPPGT